MAAKPSTKITPPRPPSIRSNKAHTVPRLAEAELADALARHPDWARAGDAIQPTFAFTDFLEEMAFVTNAAHAAQAAQHHPDILIRYNKVTMTLSTHDAGGISHKDFDLAAKLDAMRI
ncbi:MAG: 4a-hydroxytetrahydrobiopterin dehydratase [bacterium]